MLEVLVPKKRFNRYQNFQCCALRALALGCVKLSIYFSIKTYFSYFAKTFSKNINISLSVLKIYFNIILKFSLFFINSFILLSPLLSQVINSHNCHCSLPQLPQPLQPPQDIQIQQSPLQPTQYYQDICNSLVRNICHYFM